MNLTNFRQKCCLYYEPGNQKLMSRYLESGKRLENVRPKLGLLIQELWKNFWKKCIIRDPGSLLMVRLTKLTLLYFIENIRKPLLAPFPIRRTYITPQIKRSYLRISHTHKNLQFVHEKTNFTQNLHILRHSAQNI